MYPFKKILVCLDNSEVDANLIRAASDICNSSVETQIVFVNVIRDFDLPESIKIQFPNLEEMAISDRVKELDSSVQSHFNNERATTDIRVIVEQGSITKTLLKLALDEDIDLFIAGHKNRKKVSVLVTRVARRAPCSILLIPEKAKLGLKQILVPTDFSDYSKMAVEKAISIAKSRGDAPEITFQNVFNIPTGYHYTGKSQDEFAEIMKGHAKHDYANFMKNFDLSEVNAKAIYSFDKEDDLASVITSQAKKSHADVIIIGAKGRTATAALFIGSKAERLVQVNRSIPMLVVRPKGKGEGFIDYLKEL